MIRVNFLSKSDGQRLYDADLPDVPLVGDVVVFPSQRVARIEERIWRIGESIGSSAVDCYVS